MKQGYYWQWLRISCWAGVVLWINVASTIFHSYCDLETRDTKSVNKWRDKEPNPGPLAPQTKSLTIRPPPLPDCVFHHRNHIQLIRTNVSWPWPIAYPYLQGQGRDTLIVDRSITTVWGITLIQSSMKKFQFRHNLNRQGDFYLRNSPPSRLCLREFRVSTSPINIKATFIKLSQSIHLRKTNQCHASLA